MRVETHLKTDRDVLLATASYGITFIRLLVALIGAISILRHHDRWILIVSILLVMMLDYFDGVTFDRSNFSALKEWRVNRRIADSVCDRLVIQIICIPLLMENPSFGWLYIVILLRELAISSFVSSQFAQKLLVYPGTIAKIACATVGLSVIAFVVLPIVVTAAAAAVMVSLSVFALLDYYRRVRHYKAWIGTYTKPWASFEEIF